VRIRTNCTRRTSDRTRDLSFACERRLPRQLLKLRSSPARRTRDALLFGKRLLVRAGRAAQARFLALQRLVPAARDEAAFSKRSAPGQRVRTERRKRVARMSAPQQMPRTCLVQSSFSPSGRAVLALALTRPSVVHASVARVARSLARQVLLRALKKQEQQT
jgi:hypothetical protein